MRVRACVRLTASALQMVLAMWRHSVRSQLLFLTVSSPASWKLNSRFSCAVGGRTTSAKAFTHSRGQNGSRESVGKEMKQQELLNQLYKYFGVMIQLEIHDQPLQIQLLKTLLLVTQIKASQQNSLVLT